MDSDEITWFYLRSGAPYGSGQVSIGNFSKYYLCILLCPGLFCPCIIALYMGIAGYSHAQVWIHGNMG